MPCANRSPLIRLTCSTRSAVSVLRSRQMRPVLLLRGGRLDHRTHPRLAALVGQQSPHQRLAVNPVGLGPSPPARRRDRRRCDDIALKARVLQHTMEPKTVEPCLLNDDQRKQLTCPGARFRLQLGKACQEPGNITAAYLVLRHLLRP